jgi:hypothetical protein
MKDIIIDELGRESGQVNLGVINGVVNPQPGIYSIITDRAGSFNSSYLKLNDFNGLYSTTSFANQHPTKAIKVYITKNVVILPTDKFFILLPNTIGSIAASDMGPVSVNDIRLIEWAYKEGIKGYYIKDEVSLDAYYNIASVVYEPNGVSGPELNNIRGLSLDPSSTSSKVIINIDSSASFTVPNNTLVIPLDISPNSSYKSNGDERSFIKKWVSKTQFSIDMAGNDNFSTSFLIKLIVSARNMEGNLVNMK